MRTRLFLALFLTFHSVMASAEPAGNDCHSLLQGFLTRVEAKENLATLKNNWSSEDKKSFLENAKNLNFTDSQIKVAIDSLNLQANSVSLQRAKSYLTFVLSLSEDDKRAALMDFAFLDARELNSPYIKKFLKHEEKIEQKFQSKKMTLKERTRYEELYHGCRSLSPNEVNKSAAKDFKKFNLSLNLGTLAASYAFYNMDREINGEWFAKLGYDIGMTVLYSYVGSNIQTKPTDTQIVKSLKSYFTGRALSLTDIVVYDPLFNKEHEKAAKRIEDLKKNPEYKEEVAKLLNEYNQRSLYRKYKEEIISKLKLLPEGISLGVKGKSVDENNVDWNNLTRADLDRPEVQEVLVAAAMAQVYHEIKGEWIDTGDAGLDRYAFNAVFYGVQIPKSIAQNFITYRMLCMGQDNAKLSFAKAVLFNVSVSFLSNQLLFGYRQKAIGLQ